MAISCAAVLFTGCKDEDKLPPTAETGQVVSYTATTATISGKAGGYYTETGICYAEYTNPTIDDAKVAATEKGDFTVTLTGLNPETKYYARAYTIGENKVVYGTANAEFITWELNVPIVSSVLIGEVTFETAEVSASVTLEGNADIVERGFVYMQGSTGSPTIENTKVVVEGTTGNMSATLEGLSEDTAYIVAAYVIYEGSTAVYSENPTKFSSQIDGAPTVTAAMVSNISFDTVDVRSTIAYEGTGTITERGFVYSTTNDAPTTSDTKIVIDGTTGLMKTTLEGLESATQYYVRGYATYTDGTGYSATTTSFKTLAPVTFNLIATCIHHVRAKINVTSTGMGGSPWDETGIVWATTTNPTLETGSKTIAGDATDDEYPLVFCVGMTPQTKYYIRAYVKNDKGVMYSEQLETTTMISLFDDPQPWNVPMAFTESRNGNNTHNYVAINKSREETSSFQTAAWDSFNGFFENNDTYKEELFYSFYVAFHYDKSNNKIISIGPYMSTPGGLASLFFRYKVNVRSDGGFELVGDRHISQASTTTLVEQMTADGYMETYNNFMRFFEDGPFYLDRYFDQEREDTGTKLLFNPKYGNFEYFAVSSLGYDWTSPNAW